MKKEILPLDFSLMDERFAYDATQGGSGLVYKKDVLSGTRFIKAGSRAGCKHQNYWVVAVNKKQYKVHRIVWLLHHKKDLENYIDHINRDGFDNRIENLRLATSSQNSLNRSLAKNNTSGFIGVSLHTSTNRWRASIMINGHRKFLGHFDTAESAFSEYIKHKNEHTNK